LGDNEHSADQLSPAVADAGVVSTDQAAPVPEDSETAAAAPYVADAFAELLNTVLAWLQHAGGALSQDAVLPLVKALGFKPRAVISALSRTAFWSHSEADYDILLRTALGVAQHPRPLPKVYLHEGVHAKLVEHVKDMGPKAKVEKLAATLGWNARSELRKAYGTLRIVLTGLREFFFDPTHIYLKSTLDGLVEWPVNRDGRLGPHKFENAQEPLQHWTPAVDDPKAAGDPQWLNVKRQIIGTLMNHGGRCEVASLRQLLRQQPLEGAEQLEDLLESGSTRDLSKVLFWGRNVVHVRRADAIDPKMAAALEDQVPANVKLVLVDAVRRSGTLTLAELKVALQETRQEGKEQEGDDELLLTALAHIPELFFMPDFVFLRHVAETMIIEQPLTDVQGVTEISEKPSMIEDNAMPSPTVVVSSDVGHGQVGLRQKELMLADEPRTEGGQTFFSFDGFVASTAISNGSAGENEDSRDGDAPAAKRQRMSEAPTTQGEAGIAGLTVAAASDGHGRDSAWTAEVPPWAVEGAAVVVREGGLEGAIVRASGALCTVRLTRSQVEQDFATPALLPCTPTVGSSVRVVGGDRTGCIGTLVGLAGADGVVQIGKMSYETVPMSHLAVLSS